MLVQSTGGGLGSFRKVPKLVCFFFGAASLRDAAQKIVQLNLWLLQSSQYSLDNLGALFRLTFFTYFFKITQHIVKVQW